MKISILFIFLQAICPLLKENDSQEKILIPVGTAIIIVAAVKYALVIILGIEINPEKFSYNGTISFIYTNIDF